MARSSLVLLTTLLALNACETYDPGNPLRTRPVTVTDSNEPDADDEESPAAAAATPADEPAAPPPIVTPVAPPTSKGVFEGAPAFVATAGATTRKAQHNFAGNTPTTNPAGRACMQCHGANGPAPRFAVAGTIFKDDAATMPAARVEVRVVDANKKAVSAYTDADGNYFIRFTANLAFPLNAGVRDADSLLSMRAGAAAGNCNNCHRNGGANNPINVP